MATRQLSRTTIGGSRFEMCPCSSKSSDTDTRCCSCTAGLGQTTGRCCRFGVARTSSPWSSTTIAATDGRTGAPVSSMTWENLTADADALRQKLGFERWAVLGHSFGGHVALEYALRYPDSLSHLVLLDTGGDSRWAQENAAEILAKRGYSPRDGGAGTSLVQRADCAEGNVPGPDEIWWRVLPPPQHPARGTSNDPRRVAHEDAARGAHLRGARSCSRGWTVMDRLSEIKVPTLVMAGP